MNASPSDRTRPHPAEEHWVFPGSVFTVCLACFLVASIAGIPAATAGSSVGHDVKPGGSQSTLGDAADDGASPLVISGLQVDVGSAVERIDLPAWLLRDSAIAVMAGLLGSLVGALVVRWRGASSSSDQETDGGSSLEATRTRRDEETIYRLLRTNDGEMQQTAIVERTGWSKAKVSRTLSRMEASRVIRKERIGRQNVIRLEDRK